MSVVSKEKIFINFKDQKIAKKIIREKIELMKGKCNEIYGFISDITDIKILDNQIKESGIEVVVEFKIHSFQPKEDSIVEGIVNDIYDEGINVLAFNSMNIHIPFDSITQKRKPKIDDKVKVQLTCVRYDRNQFSCIGKINEN